MSADKDDAIYADYTRLNGEMADMKARAVLAEARNAELEERDASWARHRGEAMSRIKFLEEALERCKNSRDWAEASLDALQIRIKVLEEALEFYAALGREAGE